MGRFIFYSALSVVVIHGLIHLMGFVAYWPLGEIAELPYKTTLFNGRLNVGNSGMRLFSVLWLGTAVGLVAASISLAFGKSWWFPLMSAAVIVSLIITILDWNNAFRGAIISLVMLVPLLLVWGLRLQPKPFASFPAQTPVMQTVPLPMDLPAPVARYYKTIIGDDIPVIESAVITARGTTRFQGITFPARLRFTHDAGQGYRHYIEATLFGLPLMKVNERYLDGQARMELPIGVIENEPKVNMAANLGLWGESIWLPSIFITDSRVRWEAIDDHTARLIVPFEDGEDSFTAVFNPETGLLKSMTALRYREADSEEKIPWQLDVLAWDEYDGILIPSRSTATWADEGTPWLVVELEEVAFNVNIGSYIRTEGP
ncbi:DUF6544 family protein [Candidatus Leptofilum sp.]|uniref:DUF6544 family protein n=1 Tax=Candidatus Leptofilum sp. TaxID=3241576 RepID=UPI003B5B5797